MRDPIDALENFDPGGSKNPLPAAEVRRLGDRHRRRRTTGIALAAAAAVAVVATGGAVIGNDRDSRTVDPADPTPSVTTTQTGSSPLDAIDLSVNMPDNDDGQPVVPARGGVGLSEVGFCDSGQPLQDDDRTESMFVASSGPEYSDARELVVYPDVEGAARVLDALVDAAMGCPREESAPGSATLHEVTRSDVGDDSAVVSATYETDGSVGLAAEILQLVRVGNALLVTSRYSESDPTALAPVRAQYAADINPIVEQMCVFSGSCGGETASSEAPSSEAPAAGDVIPAEFPLAAGFPTDSEPGPDYGLTGPAEDVEVLDGVDVCETGLPAARSVDRLATLWANPEDYRARVLLAFADADAAVAYQGEFLQRYRDCPRDPGSDGYVSLHDVRRTAVGGESWAVVRTSELQGSPAIGLEVLHVVRVGSAVLIDITSGEGMLQGSDGQVTAQTAASAEVVAAMCAFTEAGC
ncbi:hypothetical protein [Nocardioides sp.]|uniref:hypothetical protein n=1 Tax=Nocardioides sp. TaxID=35761 RepID=UPI00286C6F23|nr:hypothetical protein [Nocardioides sp.]